MAKLVEGVDYIVIKKSLFGIIGGRYRIIKPQKYRSKILHPEQIRHKYFRWHLDGTIECHIGYEWDGATGGIDTKDFMRGSLFHDIGCQCIQEKLMLKTYRKAVDKLLHDILTEDGMLGFRRTYVYNVIRLYVRVRY